MKTLTLIVHQYATAFKYLFEQILMYFVSKNLIFWIFHSNILHSHEYELLKLFLLSSLSLLIL